MPALFAVCNFTYTFFSFLCIHKDMHKRTITFCVCKDVQKKRGKNKHIKHTHFSPFLPPFLSRPAAFGGRARLSAKFHQGNHPTPGGAHFFFSLISSRVVYISFSLTSSHSVPLPFLPLPIRSREAIQPPWILLPIFFSFLLLPEAAGWNGKDWRRKRKNEWSASGWIMRKEIEERRVKK